MRLLRYVNIVWIAFSFFGCSSASASIEVMHMRFPVQKIVSFVSRPSNHFKLVVRSITKRVLFQNQDNSIHGFMPAHMFRQSWTLKRYTEPQSIFLALRGVYFEVESISYNKSRNQYTFILSSNSLFALNKARMNQQANQLNFYFMCPQRVFPYYTLSFNTVRCRAWQLMALYKPRE